MTTLIKTYYLLTKPGIVYSNTLTAIAGFFLAARGNFYPVLFFSMTFGIAFVIASACVFNNYIDRKIDAKMARTKNRALVKKLIPPEHAIIFASIVGILGFSLLFIYTNLLTTIIAFIGFFFYVVIYGFFKRHSVYGTEVGSISGAVPPVVGYCAITNNFDIAALLLLIILIFWQMPHFYAIAVFRSEDYKSAGIPVLPIKKGLILTKIQMLIYALLFIIVSDALTFFHYTGYTYSSMMTILGIWWCIFIIKDFGKTEINRWAKRIFLFSLIIIVVFSLLLIGNSFLP